MPKRKASLSILFLLCLVIAGPVLAQTRDQKKTAVPQRVSEEVRSSAAYAEVILRKTELTATVEELLVSYTEEFPKVKNTRYELALLEAELNRFARLAKTEAPKLTLALGKLIVRRAELATDYWIVTNKYSSEHPDAVKARRKLEIYDEAVREIL